MSRLKHLLVVVLRHLKMMTPEKRALDLNLMAFDGAIHVVDALNLEIIVPFGQQIFKEAILKLWGKTV